MGIRYVQVGNWPSLEQMKSEIGFNRVYSCKVSRIVTEYISGKEDPTIIVELEWIPSKTDGVV